MGFNLGVVNAGPAETQLTTVVVGGRTMVETEIISIVGASGPTSTIAIFNAANGITLTATLILAPTEEIVTEDVDQPGELSHEHLDCKFGPDGAGQCIETLSASAGGSTISTVVTFASTIPIPSPPPAPTPSPSQSSKPGSQSPSPSPTPSSNPKPSSSGPSVSTSSTTSNAASSSSTPSTPSSSPPSTPSAPTSQGSDTTPVASPTAPTSPITTPTTNSTDEPPVTVTAPGPTTTNGTLTPPDNAAGAVGPNFLGAIAFMALIFGMI